MWPGPRTRSHSSIHPRPNPGTWTNYTDFWTPSSGQEGCNLTICCSLCVSSLPYTKISQLSNSSSFSASCPSQWCLEPDTHCPPPLRTSIVWNLHSSIFFPKILQFLWIAHAVKRNNHHQYLASSRRRTWFLFLRLFRSCRYRKSWRSSALLRALRRPFQPSLFSW